MPSIEKEPIYDVYCISRRQYQRFLNILYWGCLSGAVGVAEVVGSNLARGKMFTASIGSADSLYHITVVSKKSIIRVRKIRPSGSPFVITRQAWQASCCQTAFIGRDFSILPSHL